MSISLHQFEQIDHLYNVAAAAERRAATTGQYDRDVYHRPIWALEAKVIEVIGVQSYNNYASAQDAALDIIFGSLLCEVEVIDDAEFDADYAHFNSEAF